MVITLVYMLAGWNRLTSIGIHVWVRIGIFALMLGFAKLDKKPERPLLKLIRKIYPLFLLGYFYKETGYLNNIIFDYFDPWFVKLEEFLWGFQPSLQFSKLFPEKWFSELMNFGYFFYYLLTLGTALAVYRYKPEKTEKTVFIIIASFLLYYLFFSFFPVEGPQFYFPEEHAKAVDGYFFSYLVKMVQAVGETQTGAFPSSHVGMSIVFLLLNYRYARKVFWLILIPVIVLWFATVYIKAHYLIDTLIGFPSGIFVYWLSDKLYGYLKKEVT